METICTKKSHFDVQEFRKETGGVNVSEYPRIRKSLNAEDAEGFRGVRGGLRWCVEMYDNDRSQATRIGASQPRPVLRKACYNRNLVQWRYRLGVRTEDSQSSNPGSIPGSATKYFHPIKGFWINDSEIPASLWLRHNLRKKPTREDTYAPLCPPYEFGRSFAFFSSSVFASRRQSIS